jgi:phosphatidyl-myo-inositol alpha-mannosyltransferase
MRVCIVTPYDLSHEGGVNQHVRSLARALTALGHHAQVIGPASGPVPEGCLALPGVIPVHANGSVARIGLLVSPRATREHLSAREYDVVHVHEPIVPGPGRHAVRFSRVPVVATFHANAERELSLQRVLRRFASAGLSRISHGIAVSRAAKRFSRTVYRGRTAVIPNGVDLTRFAGPTSTVPRPGEPPRILFVGRFGEQRKGFSALLDAVAVLADRGRVVRVSVVGDGPVDRFAERAGRVGVEFLGRLPDGELAEQYRSSDVFCAPSIGGESFGMVIVEAMAAGCPVVASALPGYAEAARGAALLVPPSDPVALAEALWRVVESDELRARLVARGRARADALCWSRVAARVVHVYEAALAQRSLLLQAAPQPA